MRISDWSSDVCSSDLTSSKGLYKNLPFDPVKDFSALGLVGDTPYIVAVNPSVKAKTLKEFVALAKAKPNTLNYGSSGVGGVSHLSTELFLSTAEIGRASGRERVCQYV